MPSRGVTVTSEPKGASSMRGSHRCGARVASVANFAPNAPQEPNAAREEMRHAQAMSQNAEAPPLPRTTS